MKNQKAKRCPACGGEGRIIYRRRDHKTGEVVLDGPYRCGACGGSGKVAERVLKSVV